MGEKAAETTESIEVAGVRFTAAEVRAVTIERDGRKVTIGEQSRERRMGFASQDG